MSEEYGIFSSKDIELIHNNFSDMQEVIAKVLAMMAKPDTSEKLIKQNEAHLTRVNNKLVELIQTIETGVDIQNKQVLAEVKEITKNIANYPSDVTVKNMTQIPEWMQSDKSIKDLEKAIIQVQQRIQESRLPNQAPEDYTAVRRVIKTGNRLEFDDNPTGSGGRGGGGAPNLVFTGSDGQPTSVSSSTPLPTTATISAGDIQIGAVEIKNGTTDDRAVVDSSGAVSANVTKVGSTSIAVNTGASSAGTQRVVSASDSPEVTALQIIDDWDESDRAKVNIIVGQAGVTAGNGVSGVAVPRVTIASDSTGNIATIGTSVTPGTAATNLGKAVDSTSGATDTGVAALGVRDDVLTTLTPADGDYVRYRTDQYGSIWTHEGAVEVATPFNAALTDVDVSVKASAGHLKSVFVSSKNAAVRYLHLFNKATAPANGDTPVAIFEIAAGSATVPSNFSLGRTELGDGGYPFTTGIAVGVSTTAATFTAATTTDHVVFGMYV